MILILGVIGELITLICFFFLCSNVSKIRKKLDLDGTSPFTAISIYLAAGNKAKAQQLLLEYILADYNVRDAVNSSPANLKSALAKYKNLMEITGLTIDEELASKTKKLF